MMIICQSSLLSCGMSDLAILYLISSSPHAFHDDYLSVFTTLLLCRLAILYLISSSPHAFHADYLSVFTTLLLCRLAILYLISSSPQQDEYLSDFKYSHGWRAVQELYLIQNSSDDAFHDDYLSVFTTLLLCRLDCI